jgi:hypothetical protein
VTVIDGEVVEFRRRRERNAARTPEVLPPDVDTKVVAIRRLDSPEMQARAVTVMLSHARTGLLAAIAAHDLPQIVEFKRKAAAIQEIAKQVQLGKDLQLDAAEFVRRAERGLGVAIREGQARGEIETTAEGKSRGSRNAKGLDHLNKVIKPKPTDFAKPNELSGLNVDNPGIYGMTDGVSDEAFEEAITEARDEGNLSRANVARKCKTKARGQESVDADSAPSPTPAPAPRKRLTKHDSTEMLANINGMLNGIVESIQFINPAEIDATDPANVSAIANIRNSIGSIRKLLKEIENG